MIKMEEHEQINIDSTTSTTIMDANLITQTTTLEIKDKSVHQLKTDQFIQSIKNPIFKKNVVDTETTWAVSSIYLVKKTKLDRVMNTMVWEYYRHRAKLDVNDIIKKYKRENLIINYKIFQ